MDKFFKETLFTNFIKYTLKENPLPIYKIIRENDYMVEGVTYTHKDKILKCTQSGIFSYTPGEDVAKFTTIATYSPKAYSPKYTYNYNSHINYYDYETHRYFGEYLRQLENIYNLNLLPLYNCFSYYEVNNITLTETLSNGVLTKNKEDYRVFLIPIKFDRTYTIALESDIPILLKPIFYEKELLKDMLDQPIIDCLNSNTLIKKGSTNFKQPFTYSLGVKDISPYSFLKPYQLYEYERYLYLAIQIPVDNKSSISILEGDYTDNTTWDIVDLYEVSKNSTDIGNLLNNNLSLLDINDGVIRPFSDKLIQYILNNTIDSREIWGDNIKRIEDQINYNPEYKGFWSDTLRYILNNRYKQLVEENNKFNKYDILGYVDDDIEKACRVGYIKV